MTLFGTGSLSLSSAQHPSPYASAPVQEANDADDNQWRSWMQETQEMTRKLRAQSFNESLGQSSARDVADLSASSPLKSTIYTSMPSGTASVRLATSPMSGRAGPVSPAPPTFLPSGGVLNNPLLSGSLQSGTQTFTVDPSMQPGSQTFTVQPTTQLFTVQPGTQYVVPGAQTLQSGSVTQFVPTQPASPLRDVPMVGALKDVPVIGTTTLQVPDVSSRGSPTRQQSQSRFVPMQPLSGPGRQLRSSSRSSSRSPSRSVAQMLPVQVSRRLVSPVRRTRLSRRPGRLNVLLDAVVAIQRFWRRRKLLRRRRNPSSSKASQLAREISTMEQNAQFLEERNRWLTDKMLMHQRQVVEKAFNMGAKTVMKNVFQGWCSILEVLKYDRQVDQQTKSIKQCQLVSRELGAALAKEQEASRKHLTACQQLEADIQEVAAANQQLVLLSQQQGAQIEMLRRQMQLIAGCEKSMKLPAESIVDQLREMAAARAQER